MSCCTSYFSITISGVGVDQSCLTSRLHISTHERKSLGTAHICTRVALLTPSKLLRARSLALARYPFVIAMMNAIIHMYSIQQVS